MRFMMVMIPNVDEETWHPSPDTIAEMSKYNEELGKAGVLLAIDGLQPSAKGARVSFAGGQGDRHRRPLHRGQGDHRRLLADPGQVEGGGGGMGESVPSLRRRRDRGSSGLRGSDFAE